MSDSERMTPLLAFPWNGFLKLRLEFALLTKDVLQALILRIIENRVDFARKKLSQAQLNAACGKVPDDLVLDIERTLWVPISHASFLYELFGLVQSENTLKKALKSLIDKRYLLRRKGQGRYAPDEYQLNLTLIDEELQRMKERGKAGYQPLTPSEIDTLMASPGYQGLTPSEGQTLIPSPASRESGRDPLRVSEVDPSNRSIPEEFFSEEAAEEYAMPPFPEAAPDAAAAACFQPESLSLEEIALVLSHRCEQQQKAEEEVHDIPPVLEPIVASSDERQSSHASDDLPMIPAAVLSETADLSAQFVTNGEQPPAVFETHSEDVSSSQDVMPTNRDAHAMNAEAGAPKGVTLSVATLVALVEKKLGRCYSVPERQRQVAAAQTLVALKPSLDIATFERVYDACNDDWWKAHYGELHLSHLVEREKSGTVRFLRLFARLAMHSTGHRATVTPTPEQLRGERPLVGISGRPLYIPSGPPMKVLPPPPRERRRPGMAFVGQGV